MYCEYVQKMCTVRMYSVSGVQCLHTVSATVQKVEHCFNVQ